MFINVSGIHFSRGPARESGSTKGSVGISTESEKNVVVTSGRCRKAHSDSDFSKCDDVSI